VSVCELQVKTPLCLEKLFFPYSLTEGCDRTNMLAAAAWIHSAQVAGACRLQHGFIYSAQVAGACYLQPLALATTATRYHRHVLHRRVTNCHAQGLGIAQSGADGGGLERDWRGPGWGGTTARGERMTPRGTDGKEAHLAPPRSCLAHSRTRERGGSLSGRFQRVRGRK
jgi:hypothetical protein